MNPAVRLAEAVTQRMLRRAMPRYAEATTPVVPRVLVRADEASPYESWGEVVGMTYPGLSSGEYARGSKIPWESLPAVLYHATPAAPEILSSGYLRAGAGGGLGGGAGGPGVSLVPDLEAALVSLFEFARLGRIARGEASARDLPRWARVDVARSEFPKVVERPLREAAAQQRRWVSREERPTRLRELREQRVAEGMPLDEFDIWRPRRNLKSAFDAYLTSRGWRGGVYNPLFLEPIGFYAGARPERLGVVRVLREDIPKEVLARTGVDTGVSEVRVHGDIPLRKSDVLMWPPEAIFSILAALAASRGRGVGDGI